MASHQPPLRLTIGPSYCLSRCCVLISGLPSCDCADFQSWSTVSTGHAPLMQAHEFDKIVQNSRPHVDETGQVGPLVGRRLLLDFVIMNTQIAIELNGSTAKSLTIEWLMTMEQRQQNWADQWVRAGRSTGYTPGDEFMSLMWDW